MQTGKQVGRGGDTLNLWGWTVGEELYFKSCVSSGPAPSSCLLADQLPQACSWMQFSVVIISEAQCNLGFVQETFSPHVTFVMFKV